MAVVVVVVVVVGVGWGRVCIGVGTTPDDTLAVTTLSMILYKDGHRWEPFYRFVHYR